MALCHVTGTVYLPDGSGVLSQALADCAVSILITG